MPPTPVQITDSLTMGSSGGLQASGRVAARLLASGMRVQSLRTLDVLRKEEWSMYDEAVVDVATKRLVAVNDLMSRGLKKDIPNAMGVTRVEWEQLSDMEPAEVSMAGVTPGQRDRVIYALQNIPLPIIHKDFQLNIRALEASRRTGESLDTTMARKATRLVTEQIESMVFNGFTIQSAGGADIFGYTTATNRNTGSLGGDWTGRTGLQIVTDVLTMLGVEYADNMYGPYGLYVPPLYWNKLLGDYDSVSGDGRTILQRILQIPDIEFVRMSQDLLDGASGEVTLVQLTDDVVDMLNGFAPTMVDWESNGGMTIDFKVMAIMIPRVKNDLLLQSGVAHYSV